MVVKIKGKSCTQLRTLRRSRVRQISKRLDRISLSASIRIEKGDKDKTIKRLRREVRKIDNSAAKRECTNFSF